MLPKHPQALGREEAASLEGGECRDFCQDTAWLSWLPGDRDPPGSTALPGDHSVVRSRFFLPSTPAPRPGFSVRLNSSWFPAGAGTELCWAVPTPQPTGQLVPCQPPQPLGHFLPNLSYQPCSEPVCPAEGTKDDTTHTNFSLPHTRQGRGSTRSETQLQTQPPAKILVSQHALLTLHGKILRG